MTAQRLVRGSKARIIAGLCAVVFCVAFLVLFQKTQAELENVKKNYEICVQQQESLSTQLQVIVDYKTRLEKSLQTEKNEHKQTRTELESRINDEKTRRDKTSLEANLRYQSLQQHYKLLQTKHEDLKEKSDKLQQQYLDDIDKLQSKVKEQKEQLKQSEKNKEKSLEHLKSLYMQLQIDKDNLTEQLKKSTVDHAKWESDLNHLTKINHQLRMQLDSPKNKNVKFHEDSLTMPHSADIEPMHSHVTSNRNISKQVEIEKDLYQVRDIENKPLEIKEESNIPQIEIPNKDNNQNLVLQKPSSPLKSSTKASLQNNLNNVRPLLQPTMTPSNKRSSVDVATGTNTNQHKLPPGVVPVPKQDLHKNEEHKNDDKNIPEEIHFALPNRYRNNIIEAELAKEKIKETKPEGKSQNNINEPEANVGIEQQDNAAVEVIDHPKISAQDDPLHLMEENGNPLDANDVKIKEHEHLVKDNLLKKQHIDSLRGADRNVENGAIKAPLGGALYDNDGDYDKGQKEDLQIEEADPEGEEDDDGDDYDGQIAARQKDPAVRN